MPLGDHTVGGHTLPGSEGEAHPGRDLGHRQIVAAAVVAQHGRAAGRETHQAANGSAGFLAHQMVERAPDQQEEDQRGRRVEIGVRTVMDRIVEAQAEGEADADRDRHIHVCAAMLQHRPGRHIEDAPGINEAGQGQRRRDPVEGAARLGLCSRPDRNREQHDVHGAKTGDRQRPDQPGQLRIRRIGLALEEVTGVAEARQSREQVRRLLATPFHRHATGREVDPDMLDAGHAPQPAFDSADTGSAMDRRDRQIALPESFAEIATGEPQLLPRRCAVERLAGRMQRRTAAHLIAL